MNYQTITLGSAARKFIINCLQEGGLTMARYILARHDIEEGTVTTCFDDFVDAQWMQQMTVERLAGGMVSDTGLSVDCLIDSIMEHLAKSEHNVCMLESAVADPQFSFMQQTTLPYKVHGKEVYFVLTPKQRTRKEIDHAIGTAQSPWIFIGAMTSVPDISSWEGKRELLKSELEELAVRAEKVFVMAFDEEGYLTWSRGDIPA